MSKQLVAPRNTGLVVTEEMKELAVEMDDFVRANRTAVIDLEEQGNRFSAAIASAAMLSGIRARMDEFMPFVLAMRGTKLGFVTDRDREAPYPDDVVRDCAVQALFRGLQLINNEMNIIAGDMYAAKNGMERLCKEYPGVSDLDLNVGVPEPSISGKTWVLPATATWRQHGQQFSLERIQTPKGDFRLILPMYATDKPQTVIGKGESRMYRLLHKRITGIDVNVVGDDPDTIDGEIVRQGGEGREGASEISGEQEKPAPGHDDAFIGELKAAYEPCEELLAYNNVRDRYLSDETLTDHQRDLVKALHAEGVEAIRATRGPRSNA